MRPAVLVASPFLMERRAEWNGGYALVTPELLASGDSLVPASSIEALVTGENLDSALIHALPRLKLVACFSTSYGGIDVQLLRSRGIPAADGTVRAGAWRDGLPPRPSLRGRRAGIVGLGRIGEHIARRAETLGLSVSWWGPRDKPDALWPRAASLPALARDSDVLFVATRATADNAGQIDATVLKLLGAGGVLVNVSRGILVDEDALLQALRQRTLAGAALDVFDREPPDAAKWRDLDNVVLSPHLAGYTREAGVAMFGQLRENLRRHFAGEPLLTPEPPACRNS